MLSEVVQLGSSDSPNRTRSAAAVVAKAAMTEFYDETALMEQQHDAALRRLAELETKLARAEHVVSVLTKTSSPWTKEERTRIGKDVLQCLHSASSVQSRLGELEQHCDGLGDKLRAVPNSGEPKRVLEETQLMLEEMKDSLHQLSSAAELGARCLGLQGQGPPPRVLGDESVEALMAEQEQAADALAKAPGGHQREFQLARLQGSFEQERAVYTAALHRTQTKLSAVEHQLSALGSVAESAGKLWAPAERASPFVEAVDELGAQWYNSELEAARSNSAQASHSALGAVEASVATVLSTLEQSLSVDQGSSTAVRAQQLRKALAGFRTTLVEAGVLMAALETVAGACAPQLVACLEQLSAGELSLGGVLQAANELASFSCEVVETKGATSSPVETAMVLSADETSKLVINSMRMAERIKMVADKAKQKSQEGQSDQQNNTIVKDTCSQLVKVQALVQQLHHGTVGGLLRCREESIEAEVQRIDILCGHMHTLAQIGTQKLAPSVVNESVQKMASEVSHLHALQATFKAEERLGNKCVQAAARVQQALGKLRGSSVKTVQLIRGLQQAMGVTVQHTPAETHQNKLHDAVIADMALYRGALDIQVIEASGLRAHTQGPEGLCVCTILVRDKTGEVVSSWSVDRTAAKPATSAQWMQSTPFIDKLQMVGAECTLEFQVLELPSSGSKSYMGGAVLSLLPLVCDQSKRVSFGCDSDQPGLVLTMQHAPEGSEGEASGTLHVQVTLEPEDDLSAQRARRVQEHAAELTEYAGSDPSSIAQMPVHERAKLVADATHVMKQELCELLSAQHALVVTSLGGNPLGWSGAEETTEHDGELEQLQVKIDAAHREVAGMAPGVAKSQAHQLVVALEEERLARNGLGLRRITERSVWEGNGPMQELEDVLNEIRTRVYEMSGQMRSEWEDLASWCDSSTVWVESKLFESACYASYARMHADVIHHSDAISMVVAEGMAVLGGSYRWDDTYEEIYQKLHTAKEMV